METKVSGGLHVLVTAAKTSQVTRWKAVSPR